MAVYTKEYESQPEAILTNVIICPAVDLSANVAVPVHCQVENVLWDTGATNTLISQEVVNALGLQPKNKALISSAGGDVESWTYLVHVIGSFRKRKNKKQTLYPPARSVRNDVYGIKGCR